jgi:hypothetical protein
MEVDPATVQTNRLAKNARLELIALTDRDRQAFAAALLNPTAPAHRQSPMLNGTGR